MKKKLFGIILSCALTMCCMFAFSADRKTYDVYASYTRYVTASNLKVRKKASSKGKVVGSYKKGAKVRCYKKKGGWTKVRYGKKYRYVATRYLSKKKPKVQKKAKKAASTYVRYVTAGSLTIRKKATTKSAAAGYYKRGTSVTCYGAAGGWTKVKHGGAYCYVSSQYLSQNKPSQYTPSDSQTTGTQVANYAMQFIGNPYKWGGESLTNGADCSGFTKAVYAHFGYSLPHSSTDQRNYGTAVSWNDKQPGDLICYNVVNGVGHVGIYVGNNTVVHAGSTATGIHTSSADYRSVWGVRRIIK